MMSTPYERKKEIKNNNKICRSYRQGLQVYIKNNIADLRKVFVCTVTDFVKYAGTYVCKYVYIPSASNCTPLSPVWRSNVSGRHLRHI